MKNETNNYNGGVGFFGLLTILFVGLKLTGFIDWSWFWVLSPTLIPIIIVTLIIVAIPTFYFLNSKFNSYKENNKPKKE